MYVDRQRIVMCIAPTEEFDALSFIWILQLVVIQLPSGARLGHFWRTFVVHGSVFVF